MTNAQQEVQQAAKESLQKQSNANARTDLIKSREELESILSSMSSRIREVLPKHVTPERIIRVAINTYQRTPALAECSKTSLLGVIVKASELGLELDTLGQAYPVPFKNKNTGRKEVQLIIGYPGLIELGLRSGKISKWEAHVVYEKDAFEFEYGTNEHLTHKPSMKPDRGDVVCAYSIVQFKDGVREFMVMPRFDIEKVRAKSQMKEGMLWTENYDEACRKTVIRRHAKTLPKSPELAQAVKIDEMAYAGAAQEIDIEKVTPDGTIEVAEFQDIEPAQIPETTDVKQPEGKSPESNEFNFLSKAIKTAKSREALVLASKRLRESLSSGLITQNQFNTLNSAIDERENALAAEKKA